MQKIKAIRNTTPWLISLSLMSMLLVPFCVIAADGKLVTEIVHSPALEGNLLGDSPNRTVDIYLPPGYEENPDIRYPVIYLLHGYSVDNTMWNTVELNVKNLSNSLIEQELIQPMIIVMPNNKNKYLGSWYTNSSVTGNWEDFITRDLVAYIDSAYRTLPQAVSRGIAGASMRGYGTMKLAMKHPDIFGAAYALSSACLVFEDWFLDIFRDEIISAVKAGSFPGYGYHFVQGQIASAAAFAPNQDTQPFLCDFPLDESGQLVESVWQRYLNHDPITMIASNRENLLQLKGLHFDCGTYDPWCLTGNRIFSQTLSDANIPYVFEEYSGDHSSGYYKRIKENVLPFFSETLAFTEVISVPSSNHVPDQFILYQNHPNPFNNKTVIDYTIAENSKVSLIIYNVLGQEIRTLINKNQLSGFHSVIWNGQDNAGRIVSSGIYIYRLKSHGEVYNKKMLLLK